MADDQKNASEALVQARRRARDTSGNQNPLTDGMPAADSRLVESFLSAEAFLSEAAKAGVFTRKPAFFALNAATTHIESAIPTNIAKYELLVATIPVRALMGHQLATISNEYPDLALYVGTLMTYLAALVPSSVTAFAPSNAPLASAYVELVPTDGNENKPMHKLTKSDVAFVRLIVVTDATRITLHEWLRSEEIQQMPLIETELLGENYVVPDAVADAPAGDGNAPDEQMATGNGPRRGPPARPPKKVPKPFWKMHIPGSRLRSAHLNPHTCMWPLMCGEQPGRIPARLPASVDRLVPVMNIFGHARQSGEMPGSCRPEIAYSTMTCALVMTACNLPPKKSMLGHFQQQPYKGFNCVKSLAHGGKFDRPALVLRVLPDQFASVGTLLLPLAGFGVEVPDMPPPISSTQMEIFRSAAAPRSDETYDPDAAEQIETQVTALAKQMTEMANAVPDEQAPKKTAVLTHETIGSEQFAMPRNALVDDVMRLLQEYRDAKTDAARDSAFDQAQAKGDQLRALNLDGARAYASLHAAASAIPMPLRVRYIHAAVHTEASLRTGQDRIPYIEQPLVSKQLSSFANMVQSIALMLAEAAGSDMPLLELRGYLNIMAAFDPAYSHGLIDILVGMQGIGKSRSMKVLQYITFGASERLAETEAAWYGEPLIPGINEQVSLLYDELPFWLHAAKQSADGQTIAVGNSKQQLLNAFILQLAAAGESSTVYGGGARYSISMRLKMHFSALAATNTIDGLTPANLDRLYVSIVTPGDAKNRDITTDDMLITQPIEVHHNTQTLRVMFSFAVMLLRATHYGYLPAPTLFLSDAVITTLMQRLVDQNFLRSMRRTSDRMRRIGRMLAALHAVWVTLNTNLTTVPENVRNMAYEEALPHVLLHMSKNYIATSEVGYMAVTSTINKVAMPETMVTVQALRELLSDRVRPCPADGDMVRIPLSDLRAATPEAFANKVADAIKLRTHTLASNATVMLVLQTLAQQSIEVEYVSGASYLAYTASLAAVRHWQQHARACAQLQSAHAPVRGMLREMVRKHVPVDRYGGEEQLETKTIDGLATIMAHWGWPTDTLKMPNNHRRSRPGSYPNPSQMAGVLVIKTFDEAFEALCTLARTTPETARAFAVRTESESEPVEFSSDPATRLAQPGGCAGYMAIVVQTLPTSARDQPVSIVVPDAVAQQSGAQNTPGGARAPAMRAGAAIDVSHIPRTLEGMRTLVYELMKHGRPVPPVVYQYTSRTTHDSIFSFTEETSPDKSRKNIYARVSLELFEPDYKTVADLAYQKLLPQHMRGKPVASFAPLSSTDAELRAVMPEYTRAAVVNPVAELPSGISGFQHTILAARVATAHDVGRLTLSTRSAQRPAQGLPSMCGGIPGDRLRATANPVHVTESVDDLLNRPDTAETPAQRAANRRANIELRDSLATTLAARIAIAQLQTPPKDGAIVVFEGDLDMAAARLHGLAHGHILDEASSASYAATRYDLVCATKAEAWPAHYGCWPYAYMRRRPVTMADDAGEQVVLNVDAADVCALRARPNDLAESAARRRRVAGAGAGTGV